MKEFNDFHKHLISRVNLQELCEEANERFNVDDRANSDLNIGETVKYMCLTFFEHYTEWLQIQFKDKEFK